MSRPVECKYQCSSRATESATYERLVQSIPAVPAQSQTESAVHGIDIYQQNIALSSLSNASSARPSTAEQTQRSIEACTWSPEPPKGCKEATLCCQSCGHQGFILGSRQGRHRLFAYPAKLSPRRVRRSREDSGRTTFRRWWWRRRAKLYLPEHCRQNRKLEPRDPCLASRLSLSST